MIQIEQLTKYYGDLCAVDHIDLTVNKGQILGLLGPNGAGKSSTLRMLTGYYRPTSGAIRVKGLSVQDQPKQVKQLMGYLPESAPLYHGMLVYDYLSYVADIRGLDPVQKEQRLKKLAALCGLGHIMHRTIHDLSKGLKQRVGLAHAMMSDPEILVLDEPTSGLDPNQIVEIRDIIREIGKEKTVILSTHILSEAEATCDRVVIINRGKIVADGTTEALKQTRGSRRSLFVSLKGAPEAEVLERLGALTEVQSVTPAGGTGEADVSTYTLTAVENEDLRTAVYHAVKQTEWDLMEFRQETQSLETIFRELTKEN